MLQIPGCNLHPSIQSVYIKRKEQLPNKKKYNGNSLQDKAEKMGISGFADFGVKVALNILAYNRHSLRLLASLRCTYYSAPALT
jgi:hypothetical protein